VVFVTRLNTVGVDPASGKTLFRFAFGRRGPTVNAATPLVFDGLLFVSANYGVGARLVRLRAGGVETVWENDQTMSSQYATCVHHQGFLYGLHGREDVGTVELRCFEARTGKLRWQVPDFGAGHVILVRDQLLILKTDGTLILAPATPDGFRPQATATVSSRVTRALPALSNGRLFFRDNDAETHTGHLHCLALR
jgi:outer membrane protein assembly factor BamB